jgi:5'-nucleotidase (lipoprotein e(P4) family)
MKVNSLLVITALLFVSACVKKSAAPVEARKETNNNEHLVLSVLWYQQSGEMVALYYQGYNLAKNNLDQYLKNSKSKRKKAVIVDIDETVLDNSYYEARSIRTDSSYTSNNWNQWVSAAIADTLPGAYHFLIYAKSKGVETFYVSNRDSSMSQPTLKNLQKFNLPDADENHLFLKGKESSKEARRNKIAADYEIILLCGDNLADFYFAFDNRKESQLVDQVNAFKKEFGKRFIVFPNPMYGDWERPIYGREERTAAQRDSLRKASLVEKKY